MPGNIEQNLNALGHAAKRNDTEGVIRLVGPLLRWGVPFTLIAVIVAAASVAVKA